MLLQPSPKARGRKGPVTERPCPCKKRHTQKVTLLPSLPTHLTNYGISKGPIALVRCRHGICFYHHQWPCRPKPPPHLPAGQLFPVATLPLRGHPPPPQRPPTPAGTPSVHRSPPRTLVHRALAGALRVRLTLERAWHATDSGRALQAVAALCVARCSLAAPFGDT